MTPILTTGNGADRSELSNEAAFLRGTTTSNPPLV